MPPSQQDLDNFSYKVARLRGQLATFGRPDARFSARALEELSIALEELEVAHEELRQQHNELLEARLTLELERQHYQDLFESAPIGYLITNTQGVVKQANTAAAQMVGVLPHFLIGKPLAVYIADESRSAFRHILLDIGTTKAINNVELMLQPRRDSSIGVSLTVARFQVDAEEKQEDELRWLLYDLTERKKVEAAERDNIFASTFQHAAIGIANVGPDGRWLRVNDKLCDLLGYSAPELLNLTFQDVTHPDDISLSIEAVRKLFNGEVNQATFEKRYIRKNGSVIWALVTSSAVPGSTGTPTYIISIIEDISERKQIEAREREQRVLAEALQDTALILTSTLNYEEVLDRVLANTARVVPHDATAILSVEKGLISTVRVRGYAEHGLKQLEADLHNWGIPVSEIDLLHQMQTSKEYVLVSDWHDYGSFGTLAEIQSVRSFIGIPLYSYDELMGFLILHALTPNFFSTAHIAPLKAFAAQAATAIQNAHLYQQSRSLAALEERQRLARDLHDSISQTLYSSTVIAESLPRLYKNVPQALLKHLDQLLSLNRGVMAEMRLLLLELRPEQVLKSSLVEQIQQFVTAVGGRRRMQVDVHIEDQKIPLPPEVHIAFFRITQEAITNLTKHSRATQAEVHYVNDPSKVEIRVRDNGRGFDTNQPRAGGLGLISMRERAAAIRAELRVISEINQGTEIILRWGHEQST